MVQKEVWMVQKRLQKTIQKGYRKVTENQRLILDSISRKPKISSKELSARVGITPEKIRVNISKLKTKGFLERIGSDRGGYWKIIKHIP